VLLIVAVSASNLEGILIMPLIAPPYAELAWTVRDLLLKFGVLNVVVEPRTDGGPGVVVRPLEMKSGEQNGEL
jgi:hypothetical protein